MFKRIFKKSISKIMARVAALAIIIAWISVPIIDTGQNLISQLRWHINPLDMLVYAAEGSPTHNAEAGSSNLGTAVEGCYALNTTTYQISFVNTKTQKPIGQSVDVSNQKQDALSAARVSNQSKFDIKNAYESGQNTNVLMDTRKIEEYKPIEVKEFPPSGASTEELDNFFKYDGYKNIGSMIDAMVDQGVNLGMSKEEIMAGIHDGSIALAYEPRAFFNMNGQVIGLTAAQVGGMAADCNGTDMFRAVLGNLLNNTLPNSVRLAFEDQMTSMLGIQMMDELAKGQYASWIDLILGSGGIGLIYDKEGAGLKCCAHQADCPCGDGPDCLCFSGHLSPDNPNPVPCGPGVPGCPCAPDEPCCNHPPTCPCDPGNHPDNDPNCTCPEDHPGTPCGPDQPECKCFDPEAEGENPSSEDELVIKEDEMMQAFTIDLKAQPDKKFEVTPAPKNSSEGEYRKWITKPGDCDIKEVGKPPRTVHVGSHEYHELKWWTVYSSTKLHLNKDIYMSRKWMDGTGDLASQWGLYKLIGKQEEFDIEYGGDVWNKDYTVPNAGIDNDSKASTDSPLANDIRFSFISHRQGAGKPQIPIAAYMKGTSENDKYKKFMNERVSPPINEETKLEWYVGLTDSGEGNFVISFKYEAHAPEAVKTHGTGDTSQFQVHAQKYVTEEDDRDGEEHQHHHGHCPNQYAAYKSQKDYNKEYNGDVPVEADLPRADYNLKVKVEGTVVAPVKSVPKDEQKETFRVNYKSDDQYTLQSPMNTWTFYPTFRLTADYTPTNSNENNPVWVLAAGARTFNANDVVRIDHIQGPSPMIIMKAPWSRDYEDRGRENNVAKAGQAYNVETKRNIIDVNMWVTLIDPNFVEPSARAGIVSANQQKLNEYGQAMENILNAGADAWKFATNLRGGSTSGSLMYNPITGLNQEDRLKTELKYIRKNTTRTTVSFDCMRSNGNVDGYQYKIANGLQDYSVSTPAGSVTYTDAWKPITGLADQLTKAQSNLNKLLHKAPGKGWYKEDYEGIIVVHMQGQIGLSDGGKSDYTQIYRHESDWRTATNDNSLALVNKYAGKQKIPPKMNGVMVEFDVPEFTVSGKTVKDLPMCGTPYMFDERGNVFDDT